MQNRVLIIRTKSWCKCVVYLALTINLKVAHSLILGDLPTPSFIVDLTSFTGLESENTKQSIPALHLPEQRVTLFPITDVDDTSAMVDYDASNFDMTTIDDNQPYSNFFLHSSVIRAKSDFVEFRDESKELFLAEIDLPPSLTGYKRPTADDINQESDSPAKLCLGLNNHHVGGYYWARSAGSGASMEAPGVVYSETDFYQDGMMDNKGILQWSNENKKEGSSASDNTNDGKRSEWVNFLRLGDTVQLIPKDEAACLLKFIEKYDFYGEGSKSLRVFGVTMKGRPMGSDPKLVCEWRCG